MNRYGFIAEDVFKVNPLFTFLSVTDQKLADGTVIKQGEPFAVNYDAITSTLVNAVQELHIKVDAQQKQIDALTKRIEALEKK